MLDIIPGIPASPTLGITHATYRFIKYRQRVKILKSDTVVLIYNGGEVESAKLHYSNACTTARNRYAAILKTLQVGYIAKAVFTLL